MLFSEDAARFYYGDRSIDKDLIAAVRVLINGAPIAALRVARASPASASRRPTSFDDRPEGIARDRWDVAHRDASTGTMLVECGAIRERVSQELARAVFDAVKRDMDRTRRSRSRPGRVTGLGSHVIHHSVSGTPGRDG